jgi:hypothetical protein
MVVMGLVGCGSDDVTGTWCGKEVDSAEQCTGDDAHWVTLDQSGNDVTGTWCETAVSKDCVDVTGARLEGDQLTIPKLGKDQRTLEMTLDGDVLEGVLHGCSTCDTEKCMCELAITLHRVDD